MSVPARRKSKSRNRRGRSHDGLTVPALTTCPQCKSATKSHQACPVCGTYKKRQVSK